jgi:hypothetical protein
VSECSKADVAGDAAASRKLREQSLTIIPEAAAWGPLLRHRRDPRVTLFRRELSLPTGRPIIMTGHQAEFWHPGIAAKYLAADSAAKSLGAAAAWIVVDQDPQESISVRYPVRDAAGRLAVRTREFTAAGVSHTHAPHDELLPSIREGLERIETCFNRSADEPRLAARIASATRRLLEPHLREATPRPIYASGLWRTTLMKELVERMRAEPERVRATYNAAVRRHPTAGIRELLANDVQDVHELPLWRLTPDGERIRVYAEMLADVPREELAPRALLMTGLLRLAGCDLFIHGTGGGGGPDGDREGYDRITEEWLASWLGLDAGALAPVTVVTATRRLRLAPEPPPSAAEIARAVWRAHHARHEPAMLSDEQRAARKRMLVAQIAARGQSRDRSARGARAALFDELQQLLAQYRESHRQPLLDMHAEADCLRRRAEEAEIAADRTWAFPLYPNSDMEALQSEIEGAFSVSQGPE